MSKTRKARSPKMTSNHKVSGRLTICLTMIVKDEADVIERCLESVKPFIDTWVIVDTGSTDGTQKIIKKFMADIPGELFERPWIDFGSNRSEAIKLARGRADYQFFIDADDSLELPEGWITPKLEADAYSLSLKREEEAFWRIVLVKDSLPWRFEGVLHEYPTADQNTTPVGLNGPVIHSRNEGGRSRDPKLYLNDAKILEDELKKDPTNTRNVFYLAQSYRDAGENELALKYYSERAAMAGWDEEVWYSKFQAAVLMEKLGRSPGEIIDAYLSAYNYRPQRAESLTELARFEREREQFHSAHIFSRKATAVAEKKPSDSLFIDESVYQWRAIDEHAVSAYWVGHYDESRKLCVTLLDTGVLPLGQRKRVKQNLVFALEKIKESSANNVSVISKPNPLTELPISRLTRVVDIGANPIDQEPPYVGMLRDGLCEVVGFEPQSDVLARLRKLAGPHETYLPDVVGDGKMATLHITTSSGMTSTLAPDPNRLAMFNGFGEWGNVEREVSSPTRSLDDIAEVGPIDLVKIDIQGGELAAFKGASKLLSGAVAVHTEVSFVPLYKDQPTIGDVDQFMRKLGFIPHHLADLKRWPIAPTVYEGNFRQARNQLLEADLVYVRDFGNPEAMTDEQLSHLALIAHHMYDSTDLAYRCLLTLAERGAIDDTIAKEYFGATESQGSEFIGH